MSAINISLNADGKIVIEAVGEMPIEDWSVVTRWWKPLDQWVTKVEPITLWPAEFSSKKDWIREGWKTLGHKAYYDNDVINSVRSAEGLVADFNSLASSQTRGLEIDPSLLKLKRELTDFQVQNFRNLVTMNHGANFSVPGAGKTSTTLAVWEYFRREGKLDKLLVVCPRSAFEAWRQEPSLVLENDISIHQFSDEPIPSDTKLLFVNYEQLENQSRLDRLINWTHASPTMLAIDEAHRIKGGVNSIRWRACLELSSKAARVDILTGTPMPQSQDDLRNLLSLSWHGIPRSFFSDTKLGSLRRGGVFVRTTKHELNLPPMRIEAVPLPMGEIQAEIYSALRQTFAGQFGIADGDRSYFERRGKAVMTLLAVATNPGLMMRHYGDDSFLGFTWPPVGLQGSERLVTILEKYASHEISSKYQWVAKFVAKAASENRKVLIWSTFVGNLLALQRLLEPYDPAVIYGSTNQEDRESELKKFRHSSSCSVLLSNPQTLGEGVSLHKECHEAIYVDRSYNAGLYLQSLDRIHRLGLASNQETTVYVLESEGSIDQRVGRRLEAKIDKLGVYLNDAGLVKVSLPSDETDTPPEALIGLDDLDINDLLDHLKQVHV